MRFDFSEKECDVLIGILEDLVKEGGEVDELIVYLRIYKKLNGGEEE